MKMNASNSSFLRPAAQQAYKAGVLHRDISAGNVMIVRNNETGEWKGILIDWDMCLLWEEQKLIGEVRTQRTVSYLSHIKFQTIHPDIMRRAPGLLSLPNF